MFHVKRREAEEPHPLTPEGMVETANAAARQLGVPRFSLPADSPAGQGLRGLCMALWASRTVGLTSYQSLTAVQEGLMLPALAAFRWLKRDRPLKLVEIGAGNGGLGLTLAILVPEWHVTLVDKREKAVSFMEVAVLRLKLANATPIYGDAWEPGEYTGSFDAALFRAVARPKDDLNMAAPWLKPGGASLIWTSARSLVPREDTVWSQLGSISTNDGQMSVLAYRKA